MATLTQAELEKILQTVQAKAATDPQFRQQVLTDPKAAFAAVSGQAAPEGFTWQVIEADPTSNMTLVLPPLQTDALSDDALDAAAGGGGQCRGYSNRM